MAGKRRRSTCEWVTLDQALKTFVLSKAKTQSSEHIKALHWYVASRLVIEGGFSPEEITPRPPFRVDISRGQQGEPMKLVYDPAAAGSTGERTLLGGLKTKKVDVVVAKNGIGPCLAISIKGILNAFRNLTNRMEEAVGDCTNLHISYPALVYGFLHAVRANREGPIPDDGRGSLEADEDGNLKANDIALSRNGEVSETIRRYGDALTGLSGRKGIRNDFTRYEAVGLVLVEPNGANVGSIVDTYPPSNSPLQLVDFFEKLYRAYDQRFVYGAPELAKVTRRLEWSSESPAVTDERMKAFTPRFRA